MSSTPISKSTQKSKPPAKSTLAERAHAKANAQFWKPEKAGDSIEGVVVAINTDMGNYGSTHWHVRQDDGAVLIVSAAPESVLAGKLAGEHVEVGDRVYVELLGEKKSKSGSVYKDWATASEKAAGNGKQEVGEDDIPY